MRLASSPFFFHYFLESSIRVPFSFQSFSPDVAFAEFCKQAYSSFLFISSWPEKKKCFIARLMLLFQCHLMARHSSRRCWVWVRNWSPQQLLDVLFACYTAVTADHVLEMTAKHTKRWSVAHSLYFLAIWITATATVSLYYNVMNTALLTEPETFG